MFEEEIDDELACPVSGPVQSCAPVSAYEPDPTLPQKTWGPILSPRMSSRIARDGRNTLQKAKDLKKAKNLEIPKSGRAGKRGRFVQPLEGAVFRGKSGEAGSVLQRGLGACSSASIADLAGSRLTQAGGLTRGYLRACGGTMKTGDPTQWPGQPAPGRLRSLWLQYITVVYSILRRGSSLRPRPAPRLPGA